MKTPEFLQLHQIDDALLAREAAQGLKAARARVAPKFFYDALGSRLFDAITELPEYYPTRTEAAIFTAHGAAIADAALAATGPAPTLVDLGAGNCAKAARLFPLLAPRRYVAVDISIDYLRQALAALQREHPATSLVGVGLDFSSRLELPAALADGPALLFYPGSSIGNFAPDEALRLLRQARAAAAGGALLIGVDLVKPASVLEPAYDDALGVTAAFNLNLLRHLNRLLQADFVLRDWRHVAFFDAAESRIEMHLEARRTLTVTWPDSERVFAAGERIHTENSAKWRPEAFDALLRTAGFTSVRRWTDAQGWFAVCLAAG
ncbi:MAG: L-histidine N(alpha)-methyltransferase [Leptothrix sp. (in: Bacteria)]|nr:L-histidine N(alpha)-methyltransferase [Leptothrix sp. (in: b-proteobacteria)]